MRGRNDHKNEGPRPWRRRDPKDFCYPRAYQCRPLGGLVQFGQAQPGQSAAKAHLEAREGRAMSAETLLSRLDKVKRTGANRWQARCPAHDDRGPSLAVRELDDGRVLVHCFAGCDVREVLAGVSLPIEALFPERDLAHGKPERRPFPAADVLRSIAFEALVVATAGTALLTGHPFTSQDRERLMMAVRRIQAALEAAGVRRG